MIWRKCPCCGKRFSIFQYMYRDGIENSEDKEIICKHCQQQIVVKEMKSNNPGTLVFLFFIFIFYFGGGLHTDIVTILIYAVIVTSISYYVQFLYNPVRCTHDTENIEKVAVSGKATRWVVIIVSVLFLLFIFLSLFSFALDYKEKQKNIENNVTTIGK